jgi:hypothetical protein
MPLFSNKGGSLQYTDADGKTATLHYGPGLHKSCPECKVAKGVRCITNSGKLLNKTHRARLS